MSSSSLPVAFTDWAREHGYGITRDGDDLILANDGGELRYHVRLRPDGVELLRAERAEDPTPVLIARRADDVARYLVTVLGYDHRAAAGLPTIRLPFEWSRPAPGFSPVEQTDGWTALRDDATGTLVVRMVDREVVRPVIMFSYVASAPVSELIASYEDPTGEPLLTSFVR